MECSETSAYKIQTPGNYPEENILYLEHGESLKSRRLMKMEETKCSETSAYKIQTLGNYPEENIQHLEQGESLKSIRLMKMEQSVPKRRHIKFGRRGITQNKTYNI
jgi:uncharacterized membrane protein